MTSELRSVSAYAMGMTGGLASTTYWTPTPVDLIFVIGYGVGKAR